MPGALWEDQVFPLRTSLQFSQVEDQSQTNSCCANAVAGAYEYINKRYAMSKGGIHFRENRGPVFCVGKEPSSRSLGSGGGWYSSSRNLGDEFQVGL